MILSHGPLMADGAFVANIAPYEFYGHADACQVHRDRFEGKSHDECVCTCGQVVKVTRLTPNNVDALYQVLPDRIESGEIKVTATTATFALANAQHPSDVASYWGCYVRLVARGMRSSGHPKTSLYAVARKLEKLT